MRIDSFTYEPEQIDTFVHFGYELYDGDEQWIPPLESELRHQLSPEFDFFSDGDNRHRHFIAMENGKPLGRVTAMVNSHLRTPEGERVGTVGFFETIEEYDVAEQLLSTAIQWLHEDGRVQKVWGPMNFDIWHNYRFMTRGFDRTLFLGEPYNKPYYPEYFSAFGFQTRAEWDTLEVEGRGFLERMIARGEKRYQLLAERGYTFKPFSRRLSERDVLRLHAVLSSSFSRFPGFTPVSPDEFARLFAAGQSGLKPELSCFCYNENGELAGFAAAFIDLGEAVRVMHGRQDLPARFRFIRSRHHADRINFYIGGITPEEEARRSGLGRAGFYFVIKQMLDAGYESLILTLRLKGNSSRALPGRDAPQPQREYALFEMAL